MIKDLIPVMIYFVRRLYWATGSTDIGLQIVLGVSGTLSVGQVSTEVCRRSKATSPFHRRWAPSYPLEAQREQKAGEVRSVFKVGQGSSSVSRLELTHAIHSPGPQAFRLDWNYPKAFPGHPAYSWQGVVLLSLHSS